MHARGRQHAGQRDRARALDVVVERQQAVTIALEDRQRVVLAKVFPLHERTRKHLVHRSDELVDQAVVVVATQSRMRPPEIGRIFEQGLVVGADVEADRERRRRVDAGRGGVQRELADRDLDPADALIAASPRIDWLSVATIRRMSRPRHD